MHGEGRLPAETAGLQHVQLKKRQQQGQEEAPPQQRVEPTTPRRLRGAWTRECTGWGQGQE